MLELVINPLQFADAEQTESPNMRWIEALAARTYSTDEYGDVPVTLDKLERMVHNFKENVRGQDVAIDYNHGLDRAKGAKAAGWYRDMKVAPSSANPEMPSLWTLVEFTEEAAKEIKDNQWKYFSLDWEDWWKDNDGNKHLDVIMGGGLTNRPVAKNMIPINFSEDMRNELDESERKQFAVWSTKMINDLPDSCFLYIQSGGKKDSEGKTTPRSLRHFPYKGPDGKVDLPHLRNAIARIPQAGSWLSAELKSSLQTKARRLLGGASKAMSEDKMDAFDELVASGVLDDLLLPLDEFEEKDLEHSEPGTGNPPPPRTDERGDDDPAIRGGWRRDTPPDLPQSKADSDKDTDKGGGNEVPFELVDNDAHELLRALELPVDADGGKVVEAVKLRLGELHTLKVNQDAETQEKQFAERYPVYWQEHNRLMEEQRDTKAKLFSESVAKIRKAEGNGLLETKQQLSPIAKEKVAEVHKKFAEGKATVEDFEAAIKAITSGGIIQFGEIGSSKDGEDQIPEINTDTAQGVAGARKMFGELVNKIQEEHPDWEYQKCIDEAGKKHPDLRDAYQVTLPA